MPNNDKIDSLVNKLKSSYKEASDDTVDSYVSMLRSKHSNESVALLGYVMIAFVFLIMTLTLLMGDTETINYTNLTYFTSIGGTVSAVIIFITHKLGINDKYIDKVCKTVVDITDKDFDILNDYYTLNHDQYPLYVVDLMVANIQVLNRVNGDMRSCQEIIDDVELAMIEKGIMSPSQS